MVAEESQGRAVPEAPQACEAHNRADRRIETKTQSRTRMHALESESARLGPGTQHTEVIEMAEKHSCSVTTNDAHDSSTRSERGTRGVANPPAGEPQANGKDTPNRVALEGTAPSRWQSCLERFAKLRANVAKHVLHIGASAMALARSRSGSERDGLATGVQRYHAHARNRREHSGGHEHRRTHPGCNGR